MAHGNLNAAYPQPRRGGTPAPMPGPRPIGGLAFKPAYKDYEAGGRFPKANKIFRIPPAPSRGSGV